MWHTLPLAMALAAAIAVLAFRRGSLSTDGAIAAAGVGTIIFTAGGVAWGAVLIFFFVSSSALGRLRSERKSQAEVLFAKGHRRDAGQVLANGGIATLLALGQLVNASHLWDAAFIGSMAAVTADTWATELGTLSRQPPRRITNLSSVEPGTSGAVTMVGLGASMIGALLVGVVAGIASPAISVATATLVAAASGVLGALTDSLLGATLQVAYHCDRCGQPTEARRHRCGAASRPVRGVGWIDNDVVNVAAATVGAVAGATLSGW